MACDWPESECWVTAPRLNKQIAILELDNEPPAQLLLTANVLLGRTQEVPVASKALYAEGTRMSVLVSRYERDAAAKEACVEHFGCKCFVCGFSFAEQYGAAGEGVIEVHHLESVSASGPRLIDPTQDLRPLCSNCHTMVHRRFPAFSLDEVKAYLKNA